MKFSKATVTSFSKAEKKELWEQSVISPGPGRYKQEVNKKDSKTFK